MKILKTYKIQKKIRKYVSIFTLVCIFCILLNSTQLSSTSNQIPNSSTGSQVATCQFDESILINHLRGSTTCDYSIRYIFNYNAAYYDGTYSASVQELRDESLVGLCSFRNLLDASEHHYAYLTSDTVNAIYVSTNSYTQYFYITAKSSFFPINNSASWTPAKENLIDHTLHAHELLSPFFMQSAALGGGTTDSQTTLSWHLEPSFILNSTYYSKSNTKIFTKCGYAGIWTEFTYDNVYLTHPYYKTRIIDLNTNQIIFEDFQYQIFTVFRTISINALNIQNNANEPINASFVENGHYKGISFDFDIPNQRPPENSYMNINKNWGANNNIIVNKLGNHNKILRLWGGSTSVQSLILLSTNFLRGSIEYWEYINGSYGNNWENDLTLNFEETSASLHIFHISNSMLMYDLTNFYNFKDYNGNNVDATPTNQWVHSRYEINGTAINYYLNGNFYGYISYDADVNCSYSFLTRYANMVSQEYYYDAFDWTDLNGYNVNRNMEINNSASLYNLIAFPNEPMSNYQGFESFDFYAINTKPTSFVYANHWGTVDEQSRIYIQEDYQNHHKVLNCSSLNTWGAIRTDFASQTGGSIELWINVMESKSAGLYVGIDKISIFFTTGSTITANNGGTQTSVCNYIQNIWNHVRIVFTSTTYDVYLNHVLIIDDYASYNLDYPNPTSLTFTSYAEMNFLIDAIDYSWANGYFLNRNMLINYSTNLNSWDVFQEFTSGYYKFSQNLDWGTISNSIPTCFDCVDEVGGSVRIVSEFENHKYPIRLRDTSTTEQVAITLLSSNKFSKFLSPYVWSFDLCLDDAGDKIGWIMYESGWNVFYQIEINNGIIQVADGTTFYPVGTANNKIWYHFIVKDTVFMGSHLLTFYLNNVYVKSFMTTETGNILYAVLVSTTTTNTGIGYLDNFYLGNDIHHAMNSINENTTYSTLPMSEAITNLYTKLTSNFSLQINPYQYSLTNFTSANYLVGITDLYNNLLNTIGLSNTQNSITYTPANVRTCLISLNDQRQNYIPFESLKVRLNDTLLYEERFYREIGTSWNISIYDRFDRYLTHRIWKVTRDENYIPITITKYSMKIFNQQEQFLHVSVVYDPNYPPASNANWSTWLAPKESCEFLLISHHYRISIWNTEDGSSQSYSKYLVDDDALLITSSNTLFNVLANIENNNVEMKNQFTYVCLNFTNTNSRIGSQTTLIEINFQNTNSSLGTMLLSQQNSFNFANSTLYALLLSQQNNFSFINSNLSQMLLLNENNFLFLNSSIESFYQEIQNNFTNTNSIINNLYSLSSSSYGFINSNLTNLYALSNNNFNFMFSNISYVISQNTNNYNALNSTIGQLLAQNINTYNLLSNDIATLQALNINTFNALNNSFENAFINVFNNLSFVQSQINNQELLLQTQFSITQSQITNLEINMLTQIVNLNNTITNLIQNLTNYIYLINNTIYTAELDTQTALYMESNQILGNLTITYKQNEYLTQILQKTMFSELLNWSGVNYNYSLIENQIDKFNFVNNYNNDSIQLLLKYKNQVETMTVAAQNSISQQLPASDVKYRVKSLTSGEYLSEWTDLSNKTIDFGYYEKPVADVSINAVSVVDVILTIVIVGAGVALFRYALIKTKSSNLNKLLRNSEEKKTYIGKSKNPIDSVRGR